MMSNKKKFNWRVGCNVMLVGFLVGGFLFYQWAKTLGKYTLQPGQSVKFRVNPKTEQVEFYSELILKKKDRNKLKLTGASVWSEESGDILYGVKENKIIRIGSSSNSEKGLPNNQKNIHLVKDGIVVNYQGEKVFDVTNNKPYTITITNVDSKLARFEAQVVDR